MTIELPKILDIPEKLLPIITECNNFRYFLAEGGRSGGKSQAIARWILYLCDQKKLRVVCGREIQHSVDESVYTIFVDLITSYKLPYHILATEIKHIKTKSSINFRGFREQGRQNIKGLEGVDILWVDEAQSITKETLDIIIPTIRKDKSKIYWTMNRFLETDAVWEKFWNRKDCLHISINYLENKFCPQKMKDEADICKQLSIDDYDHIWMGKPRKDGGILKVVTTSMYEALRGIRIDRPITKRLFTGDPSLGGDECVAYIINENGRKLDELFLHERDEMKIAGTWVAFANRSGVKDYAIDIIGFKGIADRIRELAPGCNMIECIGSGKSSRPDDFLNLRAEIYMYAMNEIQNKRVEYFDDKEMVKQLCDIRIKAINSRKIKIESKDDIRKRILRSPDRADAYVQGVFALQHCRPWRRMDAYSEKEELVFDWRAA
uniref:Putative terminase n=1 Tax=viral metagenome TaxID=1070528 RepID=A0A6H1ZBA4_9ZZZZ